LQKSKLRPIRDDSEKALLRQCQKGMKAEKVGRDDFDLLYRLKLKDRIIKNDRIDNTIAL
jgi:hypothetical protein